MPSWQLRLFDAVFKRLFRSFLFPTNWTRDNILRHQRVYNVIDRMVPYRMGLTIEQVALPRCGAEWVTTPGEQTGRVVLHFHGGGYMAGSPRFCREPNARLGHAAGARVLSVDYRRFPDHRWPAALDDAVDAYRYLLDAGHRPESIVIVGESGGAHLTLSTVLALRDRGLPRPAGAIPVSPWVNAACEYPSIEENRDRDVLILPVVLQELGRFMADGRDLRSPEISPAFADFRDLPPLLLLASECEVLRDDARVARDRALAAGVSVRHVEVPDVPHAWTGLPIQLPEARETTQVMAQFIREVTAAAAPVAS